MLQKRVDETHGAGAGLPGGRPLGAGRARHLLRPTSSARSSTTPSSTTGCVSFFSRTAPELVEHVELWEDEQPLFEAYGVEEVLDSTLSRRVDLPSGGYLMIDYAEALTVIDVNSGSFIGRGKGARLEDTITKTNLEAADEVVRQLRLRDIGGIIVIDFIDMARARNRDAVLKTLRKALDEDRTKTFVVEISPLGLVEMTRQNVTDGRPRDHDPAVPDLRRRGRDQVRGDDRDRVRAPDARSRPRRPTAEAILIQMNPRVSAEFTGNDARVLHAIEEETGKWFHFEGSEGLPLEHFAVAAGGRPRGGARARAAVPRGRGGPRRDRRAAHVQPRRRGRQDRRLHHLGHAAATPYVGEKHLVRIEEVGRTPAVASLVDVPSPARERRRPADETTMT